MAILTPEESAAFAKKRLGLQSGAEQSTRRLGEDFDISSRLLGDERDRGITDTGHQIASQGLYNSGIRINEQGQIVRQYNESMSDLNLNNVRGKEDIQRNLATGLADIGGQEASALADANRREQEANDRRAQLEAIANAAPVAAPYYPNPVIIQTPNQAPQQPFRTAPIGPSGAIGPSGPMGPHVAPQSPIQFGERPMPAYTPPQTGGSYNNWPAFAQKNKDLADLYLRFAGGDMHSALQKAIEDGYVINTTSTPRRGVS